MRYIGSTWRIVLVIQYLSAGQLVFLALVLTSEPFRTLSAFEGFLTGMNPDMSVQVGLLSEFFWAKLKTQKASMITD